MRRGHAHVVGTVFLARVAELHAEFAEVDGNAGAQRIALVARALQIRRAAPNSGVRGLARRCGEKHISRSDDRR